MTYEVLARKWRPQVFQDVIGQEHITQTLMNAIKTDRVAHAYLFSGSRGVGKTSVARILAKTMNCEFGGEGIPCNRCPSCTEIISGSSVDVQEIDGASNRGIDEIRELRENVRYMPASGKYRIYIIDEVHMLTLPAFNALLKTLEEPPSHVKFIFATTEPHKVPVTILSRCQRFDFKRIPPAKIIDHLEKITKGEGIEISKAGLALIAKQSEGSMRDAESLLDQVVSSTGTKVADADVTEILGIIDRETVFQLSQAIIEGSSRQCLEIIDRLYNYGYDIKEFYRGLMDQFRNLLICKIAPDSDMIEMSESEREEAARQVHVAGQEKLQTILNFLIHREQDLRFASHPRLILETTVIKLCQLGDFLSFKELLTRIESLEKKLLGSPCTRAENPGAALEVESADSDRLEDKNTTDPISSGWEDFLKFLSSRSKPIYNVLKDCHPVSFTESTLQISKSQQSFSSTYLDDPEVFRQLSSYSRDFWRRNIRIKIVANQQSPLSMTPPSGSEVAKDDSSDLPAPVQEILKMFQGEIEKAKAENHVTAKRSEQEEDSP